MCARSLTLVAALLASTTLLAADSSPDDFEQFKKEFNGRWTGEVTVTSKSEGFAKVGDTFRAQIENSLMCDGRQSVHRVFGGEGMGVWTVYYDAGKKQIRTLWVTSGGETETGTVTRDGDQWIVDASGSTADGTKTSFHGVISVRDNGNTHQWDNEVKHDGGSPIKVTNVYHRVGE